MQFDRLSAITFHNVESTHKKKKLEARVSNDITCHFLPKKIFLFLKVWRTSTPEPTATGIIWTFIKDVTRYIPLFSTPGTLILDLNNIVDPALNLTGEYDGAVLHHILRHDGIPHFKQ